MAAWLLLTFLICLHNQLSSIHYVPRIKEYRCLKNEIHQIDGQNEWLLLLASSLRQNLTLNTEKRLFCRGFILKLTERA